MWVVSTQALPLTRVGFALRAHLVRLYRRIAPVRRYVVRARHEWAVFYIDEKLGTFICYSTYGTYAYIWTAIGDYTLKEFLRDLHFDYFMGKTRPGYRCFDRERSVESIKERICTSRREGSISKATAREAWATVETNEHDNPIRFVDELTWSDSLMKALGSEYYEYAREVPDTDSRQFWAIIWPEFIKQIGGPR